MKVKLSNEILIKAIIIVLILSIPITSLIKEFYSSYHSYMIKMLKNSDKTRITIWSNDNYSKDIYARLIQRFNSTKGNEENIEIQYRVIGSNYNQILEESLKNEVAIDLYKYPEGKLRMIKEGYMIPIEDIPGGREYLEEFKEDLKPNQNIVQGKVYSVPHSIINLKLMYNRDIFKEVGITDKHGNPTPPKTWGDVINYSKIISEYYDSRVYGYVIPGKWKEFHKWEIMYPAYSSIGHTGYDFKEGKYKYIELKPYMEVLIKMKENNILFPRPEEIDKETANYLFAEGKVAMKMAQSWDVAVFDYKFPCKYNWSICDIPVIDLKHRHGEYIYLDDSFVLGPSSLSKPKEVIKVLEWINSPQFLEELYLEKRGIPFDENIINSINDNTNSGSWNGFCEREKSEYMLELPDANIISSGDYIRNIFLRILMGDTDIDRALKDLDERYNTALAHAIKEGLEFTSYLED